MSKESKEWYIKTNEIQDSLPTTEVPFNLACSYIKQVIRFCNKTPKYNPWMEFPKNDYLSKYPRMAKASKASTRSCLYMTKRKHLCKRPRLASWVICGKPVGKAQGYIKEYTGWHDIVHNMAHRIIRNHTAEHSVLEYKLSLFVKEWGYAEKHLKLIKGEK